MNLFWLDIASRQHCLPLTSRRDLHYADGDLESDRKQMSSPLVEGGGRLQIEMLGYVCWGSGNVPVMKDAFGKKTYPYCRDPLHTSYPHTVYY